MEYIHHGKKQIQAELLGRLINNKIDDMGKFINENEFEVIGRIDNSDMRGCNLLI